MFCNEYTPYTVAEIEAEITRVLQEIADASGSAQYERIKNGTDEYESGDTIGSLNRELKTWYQQLKIAKKQEGVCSNNGYLNSGQYGC